MTQPDDALLESPVNILLVDDQPANLLALEAILADPGWNLVRAASGAEALRHLLAADFAAILLDLAMPDMDGFETARLIRGRKRSRHTPILFLTAYESDQFPPAKAYTLGAVDYLVKPLIPVILRAKVAAFVDLARSARQLQVQAEQLHRARKEQAERRAWVQYAVAGLLAETPDLVEAGPRVLQAACQSLGWDAGALWTVEREAGVLRCTAFWRDAAVEVSTFEQACRRRPMPLGEGLPGRTWTDGEPVWVEDLVRNASFPRGPLAARVGLHGACALPLHLGEEAVGVLEFFSRSPRPRDEEVLRALAAVGNQVGQSVERRRAEDDLRRSQRELADFVENATVGLHWVGADGHILWANRAELEMLGYSREEYVGRHISEFHVDTPIIADVLRRLANNESLHDYEARLRCKDGSIKDVLINSNVWWERGEFVHTRCFTRDITAQKRAAEALREAAQQKDEFLAMLAHELRNPLAPLLTSLQVLRRGADPVAQQESVERMERQVHHLHRMVDDLLDVSRIIHGKVQVRLERLDLARLTRTAAADQHSLLEEAGLELVVQTPDTPVWVQGDATRLTQAVNNLLDNAARYSNPGGQVTLRVAADAESGQAIVTVADQGVGIEPAVLPRLFQPFAQADQGLDRSRGGLGLGLAVVKGLIELHGGTVEAASAGPGRGAAFTVRLPLEGELEALTALPKTPSAWGVRARILIVEDHRDAADSLRLLLGLLGHETRLARTGPDGVQEAAEWLPDVVLSDIGLPGFDGYEVARRVRRIPGMERALLVALTGYGGEEEKRRAREAGFDHHLVKPADPAALQRVLVVRGA